MSSQLINELVVIVCHYDYELKRGSNCFITAWVTIHSEDNIHILALATSQKLCITKLRETQYESLLLGVVGIFCMNFHHFSIEKI